MVYSITQNNKTEIVFGKAFTVPSYPTPVIKDIFGNEVASYAAVTEADNNRNRDSVIVDKGGQILRNMELGLNIVAKWREYVILKTDELGIDGQGIAQLNAFSNIGVALTFGCLAEAAELIPSMVEDNVVTAEIKQKFINACLSADHID